jgi:hypothetical protein
LIKRVVVAALAGSAGAVLAAGPVGAVATFTVVPSPSPNPISNALSAVFGRTATDAWAVGTQAEIDNGTVDSDADVGLALHWNGTTWTNTPTPVVRFLNQALNGVTAVSANDAWAVGGIAGAQSQRPKFPLALHWDGTSWTSVPIPTGPNPGGTGRGSLSGVVALSSTNVWAVGRSPGLTAIIEHWDGTAWTLAPVPTINTGLSAIAAVSPTNIWATGGQLVNADGTRTALIMHYDGVSWTQVTNQVSVPANFVANNGLGSLTAVSANDIWAVGGDTDNLSVTEPLIQHWNGTVWSRVPAPPRPAGITHYGLGSVAAVSSTDVYAVGFLFHGDLSGTDNFVAHWNGTAWVRLTVPAPPEAAAGLAGISVTPGGNPIWAVGGQSHAGQCCGIQIGDTLIMRGTPA